MFNGSICFIFVDTVFLLSGAELRGSTAGGTAQAVAVGCDGDI